MIYILKYHDTILIFCVEYKNIFDHLLKRSHAMNVIIIDDDANSRINGIGTYLQTLIPLLKRMGACITRVGYNGTCKTFAIREENGIREFLLPLLPASYCFKVVEKFLGLYIEDSADNLFMLHYSPCDDLIRFLKRRFSLSKISFTNPLAELN